MSEQQQSAPSELSGPYQGYQNAQGNVYAADKNYGNNNYSNAMYYPYNYYPQNGQASYYQSNMLYQGRNNKDDLLGYNMAGYGEQYDRDCYKDYKYNNDFPRVADYSDKEAVKKVFPHFADINKKLQPDSVNNAVFFIVRSTNDDDVHKAIKYQCWTSSPKNNEILAKTYKECAPKNIPIYLFFSVARSEQFLGVAQIVSEFNHAESFHLWWELTKWFGTLKIKWLFLKDIQDKQFEHIKEGQRPVTQCRDVTKISEKSGKQMMNIFNETADSPNIFEAFTFMDMREDVLRSDREKNNFLERFNQMSLQYSQNPALFIEQREKKDQQRYKKYGNGRGYGHNQYNYGQDMRNYYQNMYQNTQYQQYAGQGQHKKREEYNEYMVNHQEDHQPVNQKMEDLFVVKEKKAKKKEKGNKGGGDDGDN